MALLLPGSGGLHAKPGPFPWPALLRCGLLFLGVALGAPLLVRWRGPSLGQSLGLSLWESVPDFLWGGCLLALWPAPWGPPGFPALGAAFLMAVLPGELRWLARALPQEWPVPRAWGELRQRRARDLVLWRSLPRWLEARLPAWITGTLVLERLMGVRGPASDWMARLAARDHAGLLGWVGGLAACWWLFRRLGR
nr:hypothetical protein [uncultured Holophaga sp.]